MATTNTITESGIRVADGREMPISHESTHSLTSGNADINVHQIERIASTALGGTLVVGGLNDRSLGGALLALAGGALLYRGISGHCHVYEAFGINTATAGSSQTAGAPANAPETEGFITIQKPVDEVYRVWRAPETLPLVMAYVADITILDMDHAHWEVRGPLGKSLAWDMEVVEDRPGEFMRWESLPGAELPNTGWVRFRPAPGDRGTEVMLHFRFDPPGGVIGDAAVKVGAIVPSMLVEKALRRFKSLAETGEMPTIQRQPAARNGGRDE